MAITIREKEDIEKWRKGLGEASIGLQLTLRDDEAGHQIHAFCTELAELVPEITLANEKDVSLSGIIISPNIRYNAVPVANELGPFLNALSSPASPMKNLPDELRAHILNIATPAMLKIYISPHCHYCPQVVSQCLTLAKVNPLIEIAVIDGNLFPEEAAMKKIRSVPTLILDDSFRWIGLINLEELIQVIAERDPMLLCAETLKNIIQDGRAEELAEMMVEKGVVFPAFLEILTDIKWSVRLGAMAVFEYLAEKNPDLCHKVNVELCRRFPNLDDPVKGDIIYLLGESGDRSVISFLNSIISGDYASEVSESAKDALNNYFLSCR